MTWRVASTVVVLFCLGGCASYTGGARSLDPLLLATEPGWIVTAPIPRMQQQDSQGCGAAALAMIAGRWQVMLSVEQVTAALPAPSAQGIRLGDLRDLARANGLTAFALAGDRDTLIHELSANRPVLIGLLLPYGVERVKSHYEVLVAFRPTTDQFVTIDPSSGWQTRRFAELDAEWSPAGRPMLVVLGQEPIMTAKRD